MYDVTVNNNRSPSLLIHMFADYRANISKLQQDPQLRIYEYKRDCFIYI